MNGAAVLALRYKQPGFREFRVPLNFKIGDVEVPLGLILITITLLGTPFLSDPLAGPLPLAARLLSSTLAAYLLWISARDMALPSRGSTVGWPVEALAAAAAFAAGWGTLGLGAPAMGPAAAAAAGFALATAAVLPIVFGREVFRLGNGLILLVTASGLIRVSLAGTPVALEQLVIGGLTVVLGAAVAFLSANADASAAPVDGLRRRPGLER